MLPYSDNLPMLHHICCVNLMQGYVNDSGFGCFLWICRTMLSLSKLSSERYVRDEILWVGIMGAGVGDS